MQKAQTLENLSLLDPRYFLQSQAKFPINIKATSDHQNISSNPWNSSYQIESSIPRFYVFLYLKESQMYKKP